MRIRNKETGKEKCTYCGQEWQPYKDQELCNNCFCPAGCCHLVDELLLYSNPEVDVLEDLKEIIKEQIADAVPSISWEQLCERQPMVKEMFGMS